MTRSMSFTAMTAAMDLITLPGRKGATPLTMRRTGP